MTFSPATSVPEPGVGSVTAADGSIVVGGTADDPTVRTGTLDVIASAHPPAAAVALNAKKITGLANGAAASDAATVGQLGVASLTAADGSIVVGGTAGAPTVRTGTLDVIASAHPPVAAVALNAQKITGLANGAAASDAATVGQLPTSGTPTGAAGGALDGTYPNPGLAASVAGAGLAEAADVLSVNVDGSTLEIAADTLRVKDLGITAGKVANATLTDVQVAAANKDGIAALASMRTLGTGAVQAAAGNDARFTDSRAPNGPASGHLTGNYPNPSVDPNLFGGVVWTTITKASDESVASNATVQNDDELFFTAVNGAVYQFECVVVYASPAGAGTPDIRVAHGEDSTARGAWICLGLSGTDGASETSQLTSDASTVVRGTAAVNRGVFNYGIHAGAGGTFRLKWAQGTSDVNATIVRAGSVLRYRRIA